ncbi:MAG: hypothetical protein KC912_01515 [Proteobacteria bacterium]|nr:hypothetical protein [Pseudomonadota bacterium]
MRNHLKSFAFVGLGCISVTMLAMVGCDYEAPRSEEFGEEIPENVLSGEVVLAISIEQELGPVILLVADANNPSPPEGTGSPITLTTISPDEFSVGTNGLLSAPFTVTGIPDGEWLITGFMDIDRDFTPLFGPFGGATCEDVLGAHISDLTTQEIVPITVGGGDRVDNLAVTLGIQLSTERPAFTLEPSVTADASFDNGTAVQLGLVDPLGLPQTFRVESTAVHANALGLPYELNGPFDWTDPAPCETGMLVTVYDKDLDGVADDHPDFPGVGLSDIWPRVFLTYLGTSQNADGSWNGAPAEGESWAGVAAYSPLANHDLTAIAAIDGADNDRDGAVDEAGEQLLNTPVILAGIDLAWLPAALHFTPDGESEMVVDESEIPAGHWDVTVILETGQTWTVPNAMAVSTSTDPGFEPARQAETLYLQAAAAE